MVASTTRLQKPNSFIINDGTNDLEYPIATKKGGERLWRSTKVRIQPGQGELVKHWDSWHSGMGWSRDESRDSSYPPAVYESAGTTGVTATHRGFLYPHLALNSITLSGTIASINRITEMGDYIYTFSTSSTDIRVHKIDPSDHSVVYERTFSGWTAPAGQTTEFGGYLYVPSAGNYFKELTTVVGDLTAAWYYDGTNYTDSTTVAAANGGTPFTILADHTDDIYYFGAATKFDGVYFDIETAAGSQLTMDWEFWNGSAWTDMVSESDGTTGLTVDGWVTWVSADQTSWATATPTATSMGGSPPDDTSRFWVRVKTTTATPWTAPTSDWLPISDVWTDGPKTADANRRLAWHMCTAGKLLWRVGDNSDPSEHYTINSCAERSTGGAGGPLTYGNWSDTADYIIGKPGRNINSLGELGRWLYVGKEEGMWGSDSSGNQTNALDFVRNLPASTNCSDLIRWLGTLITTHKTGCWQHTGVSSLPVGLETLEGNLSSVKGGRYVAFATAGEWLFAIYSIRGDLYLLAVRPGHANETPVVWHELYYLGPSATNCMHISGINTSPELYLPSILPGSNTVNYITLADDGSPDPTDTHVTFQAAEALVDFPAVDWGMPGTPKQGHMVEIVTSQAKGTGGTVKVYYGWDEATPSTQLDSTITTATKTQCFWAGGNTEGTHWGYRPQVRIGITGHASNVLRVDKVSLYCVARPRMEPAIETVIRIGDNLDKQRTGKDAYDELDALVHAGVYDVRDPDDPAGGTFKAIVHNIEDTKGEQIDKVTGQRYVTVTLRRVIYS